MTKDQAKIEKNKIISDVEDLVNTGRSFVGRKK
jgi:hypothetical protein